ncbi:MAG: hypothetical protein ACJ786_14550 [Catenulispora sp.]
MSFPTDAPQSEDSPQWQAVASEDAGAGGYAGGTEAAYGGGGAGGAGGYGGQGGAPGEHGGGGAEGASGESEHGNIDELVHAAIEHGAVHVVDHIVHGVFRIAEGTFTLAILVLEIALGPGDTAMHPVTVRRYVASCDGDHNGASWQGPYRDVEAEAADDIARHNYEWPGHAAGVTSESEGG